MAALWFAGVALSDARISFDGHSAAVHGARAYVEEDGEVVRRDSWPLGRLLGAVSGSLGGVLGAGRVHELFLLIEGCGFSFVVPCDPTQRVAAREFAATVNTAGARSLDAPMQRGAGPGFPRAELSRR